MYNSDIQHILSFPFFSLGPESLFWKKNVSFLIRYIILFH